MQNRAQSSIGAPSLDASWAVAREAAQRYWRMLSDEPQVSEGYRRIAGENAALVAEAGRKFPWE